MHITNNMEIHMKLARLHKMPYPTTGRVSRFVIRMAHLEIIHQKSVKKSPEFYASKNESYLQWFLDTAKVIWKWAKVKS